jgi:hypothetical protein
MSTIIDTSPTKAVLIPSSYNLSANRMLVGLVWIKLYPKKKKNSLMRREVRNGKRGCLHGTLAARLEKEAGMQRSEGIVRT